MGWTEKPCKPTLLPWKVTLVRHKPLVRLFGNLSRKTVCAEWSRDLKAVSQYLIDFARILTD